MSDYIGYPPSYGLDHAHWTAAALATSLYQTTEIAVSARSRRACYTKHAVRPYRPTSQYRQGDAAPQEAARQALEFLQKADASALGLLRQDEARVSMLATLRPTRGDWSCTRCPAPAPSGK